MMDDKALTVVNFEDYAMTADKIQRQVNLIQEVMQKVMKEKEHYGTIPGCGPKPTLLKPGAEKLSSTFRLAPFYDIRKTDLANGHREYEITCTLKLISTDYAAGQGVGSCSTIEGKFRFRNTEKKCPECDKEAIIKGKAEYGGGWLCFKKKGGCGTKWQDGEPVIEDQADGKVEHDNPADYYNTVLKMAKKRAHVDAVLTATAASDIFTQDIEDMPEVIDVTPKEEKPEPKKKPKKKAAAKKKAAPKSRPLIKEQGEEILKVAANMEHPLSTEEAIKVIDWYCAVDSDGKPINNEHGGRNYEAGQALIFGFDTILDRYMDHLEVQYTSEGEK